MPDELSLTVKWKKCKLVIGALTIWNRVLWPSILLLLIRSPKHYIVIVKAAKIT